MSNLTQNLDHDADLSPNFKSYCAEITSLLSSDLLKTNPNEFNKTANSLLKTLKIEARDCINEGKVRANEICKSFKNEIDRLYLLSGNYGNGGSDSSDSKELKRLAKVNDKINTQNTTINNTLTQISEMEEISSDISSQLMSNREVLVRQKEKIGVMKDLTAKADGIAKRMGKWWS